MAMKKGRVVFFSSMDDEKSAIWNVLELAVNRASGSGGRDTSLAVVNAPYLMAEGLSLKEFIDDAEVVVCDLGAFSPNAMYELGIALALEKPVVLLVNNEEGFPFDLHTYRYISYSLKTIGSDSFVDSLARAIQEALVTPEFWIPTKNRAKSAPKPRSSVFVSYSHRDGLYLDRLKVHIKPLERKRLVQLWSDTLLQGGERWKTEIEKALESAAIAVLLISADFLASDFIVDNELQPLLKAAESKGTIVIPVILKPCRFLREPTIAQFQAINEPSNPLCRLSEYEQESIYERLAERIEVALGSSR